VNINTYTKVLQPGAEFIGARGLTPMSQDESKMLCENNKGYAIDA